MIELLFAVMLGLFVGCACGIFPGLHPNSTIPIILGFSFLFQPLEAAIILISAGVTNSFVSFIPAVFLGAPEADSALSVLPGHRLLLQGRGFEAVRLTVVGGLGATFLAILLLPVFSLTIPSVYHLIRPVLHWILLALVFYMIMGEEGFKNKILAAYVFLLSGMLGYVAINYMSVKEILFPLLTGLFGLPLLLLSVKRNVKLPESFSFEYERIKRRSVISGIGIGSLAGIIAGLLPGLGSSQATVIAQEAVGHKSDRNFLIAIGGVNTSDVIYSLLALYLIGNARSGIAVAVGNMIAVGFNHVLLFLCVIVASAGVAAYITIRMTRKFVFFLKRMDYRRLCLHIFVLLFALVAIFSGSTGLVVALVALSIGLIPNIVGIKRSHCMGCLLLPTILLFAGLSF
ncbi:MAG: tripartite tricarboxylate transporter permease [Candidatus Aenigmatarchaeota archaeon]